MKEITVQELKEMMDAKSDFQLIDVREEMEFEHCNIGGQLIPMGIIMDHLDDIATDKKVVLHCKSGRRSATVLQILESKGYTNLYNLQGGILAWSDQIDPTVPKY
jgi:rhodanese-related sulfurtransferase